MMHHVGIMFILLLPDAEPHKLRVGFGSSGTWHVYWRRYHFVAYLHLNEKEMT